MVSKNDGFNQVLSGVPRVLPNYPGKTQPPFFAGRAVEIAGQSDDLINAASASVQLGHLHDTHGNLNAAIEMYKRSLEINEKLERQEGIASDNGFLGNIYKELGDLDGAERRYKMSLEINEKLENLQGMANQYGNLGIIFKI